jgi:hypothetical protein
VSHISNTGAAVVAQEIQTALPGPIWYGTFQLQSTGVSTLSLTQAANLFYGNESGVADLQGDGFESAAGSDFTIGESGSSLTEGNASILVVELSDQGAVTLLHYMGSNAGSLPGVPGGVARSTVSGAPCNGDQCATSNFAFAANDLLVEGGENCDFVTHCADLGEQIGTALYRAMTSKPQ